MVRNLGAAWLGSSGSESLIRSRSECQVSSPPKTWVGPLASWLLHVAGGWRHPLLTMWPFPYVAWVFWNIVANFPQYKWLERKRTRERKRESRYVFLNLVSTVAGVSILLFFSVEESHWVWPLLREKGIRFHFIKRRASKNFGRILKPPHSLHSSKANKTKQKKTNPNPSTPTSQSLCFFCSTVTCMSLAPSGFS